MSTFLTAQSLSIAFTSIPLFEDVSFTLNKGDRIGLIGHNGCGKSSLLKLVSGEQESYTGKFTLAKQCVLSYVEQQVPQSLKNTTLIEALSNNTKPDEAWRAECLLSELGFKQSDWLTPVQQLSGGQHMRLLLARAVINQPDLLLLDEPSNHLDLPSLLWLETYLLKWKGSFVLVSHDQTLLDKVTNTTWIMRDKTLHHFNMPCSKARQALLHKDETDLLRRNIEQKEIDRLEQSAKRLANWGKVYDNEDLARKAKTMQARKERLVDQQTALTDGSPWRLTLKGEALQANRLLNIEHISVTPQQSRVSLFDLIEKQVKSGDKVAILGSNGSGKSTALLNLHHAYSNQSLSTVQFHPKCRLGYYDQSLQQLEDNQTISDALVRFAPISDEQRKRALISAGFEYHRHSQKIHSLSGGERSRLLFVGLTLARYHLLFLDEPTNHLDLEGKEELFETLRKYVGGALIVTHDRALIEQSCNRFWLINNGELTEYLDVHEIYTLLEQLPYSNNEQTTISERAHQHINVDKDSDALLQRLVELESLLEEDLRRKPKHQKKALQEKWRLEIELMGQKL